ncbi:hypothetical protein ABZS66_35710 [Dactylosporangium sp. NPDC005572]|uniref:hypothetical protein n=1 Tax=Dactylosporangium sp. NPDC005572 TaxID=3156889 RepID=UPI0033AFD201
MTRGERDWEPCDAEADGSGPLAGLDALVDSFGAGHRNDDPVAVLRELVKRPENDDVLADALARCWALLREKVTAEHGGGQRGIDETAAWTFRRHDDDTFLHWLALTLAADVVRPTRADQLRYLLDLAGADPYALRHIFAPSVADRVGTNEDQPLWDWKRVLVRARDALDDSRPRPWSDAAGRDLARRAMASVSTSGFLDAVRRIRGVDLSLLPHVAELDRDLAFELGSHHLVIREQEIPAVTLRGFSMSPDVMEALRLVSVDLLDMRPIEVGKIIGFQVQTQGLPRTPGSVAAVLGRSEAEVSDRLVTAVALLWADLRQLVQYENPRLERWKSQDQIRGVLAHLTEHASRWPEAWAISVRDILRDVDALGRHCTDLLAYAAGDDRVRAAITAASSDPDVAVGDRARGIDALIGGTGSPGEAFRQWVASTAAQAFDGTTMSPRPLSSMSRTWLGSLDLEDTLANTLRDALWRFGDWVRTQGAAQEETGTGTLLTRIEAAFEEARLRLTAGGRTAVARQVSVSHRHTTKTEEQQWGCDLALLLDVELPGWMRLHSAALVQVKKSEAIRERATASARPPHERWKIDLGQLQDLLEMSEASFYWLLMSSGEALCVRALWIHGQVAGHGALDTDQGTHTIGYEHMRHASVTLDQFLPELFLGTWVGDARDATLEFARGTTGIAPRHLFEISVRLADQRG